MRGLSANNQICREGGFLPRRSTNRGLSHVQCGMRVGDATRDVVSTGAPRSLWWRWSWRFAQTWSRTTPLSSPRPILPSRCQTQHACHPAWTHREQNYFYPWTSRTIPASTLTAFPWPLVWFWWCFFFLSNRPKEVHHFYQEFCSQLSADYTPPAAFPHTAAWLSSCGNMRGQKKNMQKQKVFQKVGVITERSCLLLCKKNDLAQILVVWTEYLCSPADIWLQSLLGKRIQAASSLAINCSAVTLTHWLRLGSPAIANMTIRRTRSALLSFLSAATLWCI